MAGVHFTTTPCDLTQSIRHKESQFSTICPCAKDIEQPKFEYFKNLSVHFALNVVKVFQGLELWVNVPVATFFPTQDWWESEVWGSWYFRAEIHLIAVHPRSQGLNLGLGMGLGKRLIAGT